MLTASRRTYAFTLLELLVAISISSVVFASVTTLFITGQQRAIQQAQQGVVSASLFRILNYLKRDLKRAGYQASGHSLLAVDATQTISTSYDAQGQLRGIEYLYQLPDQRIQQVQLLWDRASHSLDLCRKAWQTTPSLGACPTAFSLLDTEHLMLQDWVVSETHQLSEQGMPITLIRIELELSLVDGRYAQRGEILVRVRTGGA